MSNSFKHLYEFGPFSINEASRLLLRDGSAVPLTSKAFDTLLLLVRNRDRVLDKDELLSKLWPHTVVEEANLAVNISAVRKALGERPNQHKYIVTIPGRGYRFVAEVVEVSDRTSGERTAEEEDRPLNLAVGTAKRSSGRLQVRSLIIAAALLLVVAIATAIAVRRSTAGKPKPGSIAVLPFKSIGSDDDGNYLGLGMADALIVRLGNIKQVVVRPTSAVRGYTDPALDPVEAGREMGVDSVLEGSVQKLGERIRVTAQLVGVGDGRHLWAGKFDENFTDIFSVQDSISKRLAEELAVELTGEESALLVKRHTEDTEAYRLYLKGRYFWNKRSPEGFKKAIENFQSAIELDPTYAQAYAGLADCYVLLAPYGVAAPIDSFPKAKAAAIKALEIDPRLAEARTTLAYALALYDWDYQGAVREFKQAISLSPNYATAHQWYATTLSALGRFDEALREIEIAKQLDPLSGMINSDYAGHLYGVRRYDEAIGQYKKTLEMYPDLGSARAGLVLVYEERARYDEAVAEYEKKLAADGEREEVIKSLRQSYRQAGIRGYWKSLLDLLKGYTRRGGQWYLEIAVLHIRLGEKEQAYEWLERGYRARAPAMVWIKTEPPLEAIRAEPRFTDLMRRAGF